MFIIRNPSLEPQRNIGKGYMNLKKTRSGKPDCRKRDSGILREPEISENI
jgi:hypothetical protein